MKHLLFLPTAIIFLMSAKGCKSYPIEGNTVGIIYPNHNVARIRTIQNSCPLKVSDAKTVPLTELSGWCVVPPEECARYTRDYESKVCGQ